MLIHTIHAHKCSWSSLNRGRGREGFLYRSWILVLGVLRKAVNSIYSMMGKTSKTLGELIGVSPICAKPLHGWCWPWSWHLIAGPTVLSNLTYLLQLIGRAFLPLLSSYPPSGAEEKSAHHRVPRRSCISSISHSAFEASTSLKNFFP